MGPGGLLFPCPIFRSALFLTHTRSPGSWPTPSRAMGTALLRVRTRLVPLEPLTCNASGSPTPTERISKYTYTSCVFVRTFCAQRLQGRPVPFAHYFRFWVRQWKVWRLWEQLGPPKDGGAPSLLPKSSHYISIRVTAPNCYMLRNRDQKFPTQSEFIIISASKVSEQKSALGSRGVSAPSTAALFPFYSPFLYTVFPVDVVSFDMLCACSFCY